MDKMREEFEESFIENSGIGCIELCDMVDARIDDGYVDEEGDIQLAMNIGWIMWKASRAALCVDISSMVFSRDRDGNGGLILPERVFKAMDCAGVTYK